MGLFENLFLDKDTPMMINTGDVNLKDIPTATPAGGGGGGGGTQGAGSSGGVTQGGGTSQGGATSGDQKVIPSITLTSVNSPTVMAISDVPASSGLIIGESSNTIDAPMSFDIGGDILYADAVTTPPVFMITENPITSSNESLFIVNGVPGMGIVDPLTPLEGTIIASAGVNDLPLEPSIVVESVQESGSPLIIESTPSEMPKVEIQASSVISTESPLMNLMSGFDTITAPTESLTPNSQVMSPPIPPVIDMASAQPTDALFSLMDTASGPTIPTPIVQTKTNISTETPIILIPDTPITPIMVATEEASPLLSEIESTVTEALKQEDDHPMSSVGKELARMTRSPRLQGKLIGFISGLEELSKEEELLKNEKRKQIESYKIRISELKAEYETRIHALELEEQNLMEQIVTMDEEREHITQVIDGFKRELEVV